VAEPEVVAQSAAEEAPARKPETEDEKNTAAGVEVEA
jgi:hypothetical protein